MVRTIGLSQLADLLADWRSGSETGYRSIAGRIRLLIVDGRLPVGARLPSERELAGRLAASRTTITAAFDDLRASGHIETRRGSGSVVRLPHTARVVRPGIGHELDFSIASAAAPPGFEAAAGRAVARLGEVAGGSGYEMVGLERLREAIADRFAARGLPTRPSQILVTSGAQPALALLSRFLLARGDRAVVEVPGYPRAHEAMRQAGARLVPLVVDADSGWDLDEVGQLIRRVAPTVVYTMPDFHNPTGRSMSLAAREALIAAAHDVGATVVVDETTAELDIDRRGSFPPLGASATVQGRIITVGSASKIMWGGLRVGWIRADEDVVAALSVARTATDLGTALLDQLIAAELFSDLDGVLEHRRSEHRAARSALQTAMADRLPDWRLPAIDGGLAAWLHFDAPVSSQMAIAARARGLRIAAGPWFGLDGAFERFIRIPFGPGAVAIEQAVDVLAEVWAEVADAPRTIERPLAAVV